MAALEHTDVAAAARLPAAGFELGAARSLIGRRLRLRQPLLGFEAGTACRVQCVVDFGDGLLLWITTDDARQADVDQIDADDLQRLFVVTDADATQRPHSRLARAPYDASWANEPTGMRTGPRLRRWLRVAGARIVAVAASLPRSLETARYAERMLSMSDGELAAMGMRREEVMDHLRERVCRAD